MRRSGSDSPAGGDRTRHARAGRHVTGGQDEPLRGGQPFYGHDLGLVMLDNTCPRPVGDVGNARTWQFPVLYDVVCGAQPQQAVERGAGDLLEAFIASARRLAGHGVRAIGTGCGFMAIYQREIAEAVRVPVATSSLLQIPTLLNLLGPGETVGVVTANAAALTEQHFHGAGVSEQDRGRLRLVGLERTEHFYPTIVRGGQSLHVARARDEVVAACVRGQQESPRIAAWVFECTNVPPYRDAVRAATGLPVFDAVTLFDWLRAGTQP